ncbi:hypothetical protein [Botrimarina sp.]|uniref:hypothetical protein n=1 Tax=Botrimarina sp. TaxID=2795802 RepID=UPI0032ED64F2
MLKLLEGVHAHFCDDRYTAFLVVTQSCDLVRRKEGLCKAQHISLAVIRELEPILPTLIRDVCGTDRDGVYDQEQKFLAVQRLVKIVNQNAQSLGLFYLHPDGDVGIATKSAALIRVTIALRNEHYPLLTDARCGRLSSDYANKLGWLAGNLFSRVATPDWEDQTSNADASGELAQQLLSAVTDGDGQNWVPGTWLKAARDKGVSLDDIAPDSMLDAIKEYAPPAPLDIVSSRVEAISRELVVTDLLRRFVAEDTPWKEATAAQIVSLCSTIALKDDEKVRMQEAIAVDEAFLSQLGHQLSGELKKSFAGNADNPIATFTARAIEIQGFIPPAKRALKDLLESEGFEQSSTDAILEALASAKCFATSPWGRLEDTVSSDESNSRIRKIINRLQNDQQVRAALSR